MHGLLAAIAAPSPTPTPTIDPELVTPGPIGFVAIAVLAFAVVLLIWDMQRRIRRVRYRAEVAEQLDAEVAEQTAADAADAEERDADPRGEKD